LRPKRTQRLGLPSTRAGSRRIAPQPAGSGHHAPAPAPRQDGNRRAVPPAVAAAHYVEVRLGAHDRLSLSNAPRGWFGSRVHPRTRISSVRLLPLAGYRARLSDPSWPRADLFGRRAVRSGAAGHAGPTVSRFRQPVSDTLSISSTSWSCRAIAAARCSFNQQVVASDRSLRARAAAAR